MAVLLVATAVRPALADDSLARARCEAESLRGTEGWPRQEAKDCSAFPWTPENRKAWEVFLERHGESANCIQQRKGQIGGATGAGASVGAIVGAVSAASAAESKGMALLLGFYGSLGGGLIGLLVGAAVGLGRVAGCPAAAIEDVTP